MDQMLWVTGHAHCLAEHTRCLENRAWGTRLCYLHQGHITWFPAGDTRALERGGESPEKREGKVEGQKEGTKEGRDGGRERSIPLALLLTQL